MNGYNILVLIVACVVLGVSIWAFVTRCNTDKFGDDDDDMTYDKFLENCNNPPVQHDIKKGNITMWGINPRNFNLTPIISDKGAVIPDTAINPLIDCKIGGQSGLGFKFNPNLISEESFNQLKKIINGLNQQQRAMGFIIPSDWTGPFKDWQFILPSSPR